MQAIMDSADSPSVISSQKTSNVKMSCRQGPGLSHTRVSEGSSEHAETRPNDKNASAGKELQHTMIACPKICQPPQESFPSVAARDKIVDSSHVVVEPASAETTGESGRTSAGCVSILHAGARPNEDRVRDQASGPFVSRSLERRPTVDFVVREALSEQHQRCSSVVDPVHRVEGRTCRTGRGRDHSAGVSTTAPPEDAYRGEWEIVPEVDGQGQGSTRNAHGLREPNRLGHRLHHPGVDRGSTRLPPSGRTDAPAGDRRSEHPGPPRADGDSSRSCESCDTRRTVNEHRLEMLGMLAAGDPCSSVYHTEGLEHHTCQERRRFVRLVEQYTEELDTVIQANSKQSQTSCRLNLLEVFCGPKSQLTHQVQQLGFKAERMGLEQCDLQSSEGRNMLFETVVSKRPEHLWFSPSCGPWSGWSTLNGSRSIQASDDLQNCRLKHLEQIALGVVLLRFQVACNRHMHWEQSQASLMFKLPYLSEIHHATLAVDFDMCTAGNLVDPQNGKHIKKGMTVLTTSPRVAESLKNKKCMGQHEHQVIEGSTVRDKQRVNRSVFSESYPRKFARDMAKVLCKLQYPKECPVTPMMCPNDAAVFVNEPALKRRRLLTQAKPKLSRSSEVTADMLVKRRKLNGKQASLNALEAWNKVFDKVDSILPRVGKTQLDNPELLSEIQCLLPDKNIQFAIACRGSDRTIVPSSNMLALEAPLRKCIFLKRGTTKIFAEDQWENWSELSQRQRVRPSHACRINITVFACDAVPNPGASGSRESIAHDTSGSAGEDQPDSSVPEPEAPQGMSQRNDIDSRLEQDHEESSSKSPETNNTNNEPHDNLQIHNPNHDADDNQKKSTHNFQHESIKNLPKSDQQMLAKIHKNLGHPSAERMSTIMLQQGFRPEMVKAARNYQCSICIQNSQPKAARPGSLKDDMDFNDRISIDGLTWTSNKGRTYHVYHVIDWATNFHMAHVAPSRTSEDAIQTLMTMWLSWARAPGEILVDAASEFNGEEFMNFLQSHNIKGTTISPEAHFQNGKAERHGAILDKMLTKFNSEHAVENYGDLQKALWWCIPAKNACSLKGGFAPEVLVLGKHTRLPGSVSSDNLLPAHLLAESENAQGIRFRQQLAYRETARRAFHSADNDSALRRAMLRRSHPHRGAYQPGEWVMAWKEGLGQTQGYWQGPMKVVVHENQQTIWVTMSSKLYRCAPEHVRPVTAEEARGILQRPAEPSISEIAQQLPNEVSGTVTRYVDLGMPIPMQLTDPNTSNTEEPHLSNSNNSQEDQPDNEPEIPSNAPSEQERAPSEEQQVPEDPKDVPVPIETDDDLICEGLHSLDAEINVLEHTQEDLAWKAEVLVTDADIQEWKLADLPEEMSFLVSAAKRQRSEIKLSTLTHSEKAEFAAAKENEIANWLKTGTVQRMFRNQIPPEQVLKCRWILTWKPIEESDRDPKKPQKMSKAKARLVVLGYLDPKITEVPRDSPTLNRHSKMLLLQLIASMSWDLRSFDIKAAFLQGKPQSGRILGLEPVPELAAKMGLSKDEICRLTKSAYGLIDAPFMWFQALKEEVLKLGFEQSPFCPCTFILRCPKTRVPEGIIGVHVDDGLCGGNQRFMSKLQELEKRYPFGSQKVGQFTFTGIDMFQHPNKAITLSQSKYVNAINPIKIPIERRKDETAKVTSEEKMALRGLIGSLQYASVHTRPDLSSRLSFLQSDINQATIQTLLEANRTLHEAKRHSNVSLTINPIACADLRFLAFSDASFASRKNPDSYTGCMIMSTHKDIGNNTTCVVNPMSWGCKKIQRVVTSTLAAETVSLSTVLDQLSWIRLCWAWLLDNAVPWKRPEQALQDLPESFSAATIKSQQLPEGTIATDCKSLFDLVTRTAVPACSEFRTRLNARRIKDLLDEGVQIRWVHSGAQLADCLTKIMDTSFLRETLLRGKYRLNDELEILKARLDKRTRLKWLKSNCDE